MEHPAARRTRPTTAWHRAVDVLDGFQTEVTDDGSGADARAQAHITALGELIGATAQVAPPLLRAELRDAARAFARAQRSTIRAEDRAAHALRTAARDIVHTATGPDGSALAALVAALVWATVIAGRWHEAKGHAHQAEAARQTLHHLQTAADRALAPVLTELGRREPTEVRWRVVASDVRVAVPEHADRILDDPDWPALAAVLADAEALGHRPHRLLKEAVARRELTTARYPAGVLITRIQHTGRDPLPNRRAEAARLRSLTAAAYARQGPPAHPVVAPATAADQRGRRRS